MSEVRTFVLLSSFVTTMGFLFLQCIWYVNYFYTSDI
jgi:hypothetical protein